MEMKELLMGMGLSEIEEMLMLRDKVLYGWN